MTEVCHSKKCGLCREVKSIDFFYKDKGKKDGLQNRCKECCYISDKKWRFSNAEYVTETNRKNYLKKLG